MLPYSQCIETNKIARICILSILPRLGEHICMFTIPNVINVKIIYNHSQMK